jgi:hypothetical protein
MGKLPQNNLKKCWLKLNCKNQTTCLSANFPTLSQNAIQNTFALLKFFVAFLLFSRDYGSNDALKDDLRL